MAPKHIFFLLLLSFMLCLALVPLGLVGHHWKLLVAAIVYFVGTLYLQRKANSKKERWMMVAIMAIPPLLLLGQAHLMNFRETRLGLPSTLAHFAGIAFACLANELKQKTRIMLFGFFVLLSTLAAFKGYPMWMQKVNFGTFTGNVNYALPAPVNGVLQSEQLLQNEDLRGKVVVLDFWHTKCGICFEKFPLLQNLYERYKGNPSFRVLAVNKRLKSDTIGQAFFVLKQRNYTFPVLVPSDSLLAEAFGVSVYPTMFVLDKTGTVIFKGNIEYATKVVDDLLAN